MLRISDDRLSTRQGADSLSQSESKTRKPSNTQAASIMICSENQRARQRPPKRLQLHKNRSSRLYALAFQIAGYSGLLKRNPKTERAKLRDLRRLEFVSFSLLHIEQHCNKKN